jgi:signal transduction histidine kinase
MKLLCVEQSPGSAGNCSGLLTTLGHTVTTTDEEAGLQLVRTRRVDAVILPGRAEGLVQDVRRLAPSLPIIVVGTEDSALAAAHAHSQGALGYVVANGSLEPDMEQVLKSLVQRAAARTRTLADRETTLRENQRMRKFYGDVVTSVQQGIVVIDHEGKVRFRNPLAARLLGEEDGTGPADGRAAVSLVQMLVETLTTGESQNQPLAFEQGEQKVFLDVTTSLLRGSDGKTTGAVATVADRSTEKGLERQLIHSERLATLGSLLASIAHEINNTLTSVTGCAEMGLELADTADKTAEEADPAKALEQLTGFGGEVRMIFDMVLEAGLSAQTIANNMLQYSRQARPSHRVKESVNKLLDKTLTVLGKHIGVEKVTLEKDLDPSSPLVTIQPAKFQQALVNLIVNAVHALLDVPEDRRLLRLSTRIDTDTDMVIVDIKDRGPGIPPKRLERIFQPFFTTKGHGTGLGLHITRSVIEEQGGQITVESTVGEGTTFSIHLPLARRKSLLDAARIAHEADGDPESTRVE